MSIKVSDLETDARRVSSTRDPPGQRSIYIPPGQPERETYRLSTFKDFPTHVQVDPCQLAASGFYFTGYQDRVKCFSCGQAVDSWVVGDEPTSPNWHQPGCGMVNRTGTNNIPILCMLRNAALPSPGFRSTTNLTTGQRRNAQNISRQTHQDNTSGTRQQGVPSPENFTLPTAVVSNLTRDSSSASTPPVCNSTSKRPRAPQQIVDSVFPCRDPINPHMRRMEARLQTFSDYQATRSFFNIRATPEEIANAGMYCLGQRDRVKCWYCNVGLQNWDFDDDPWKEHAKWFPLCEYVLQRKGLEFVHAIIAQSPYLSRPVLQNPSTALPAELLSKLIKNQSRLYHSPPPLRKVQQPITIVDPRNELRKEKGQKNADSVVQSHFIEQARMMGFENEDILKVLKQKQEATKCGFPNLESLVDTLLSLEDTHVEATHPNTPLTSVAPSSENIQPTDDGSLEELSRQCKICKKKLSNMVFIPCGHLVCCVKCGRQATKCPICKALIVQRIKTYLE